jgi:hypothetical protein
MSPATPDRGIDTSSAAAPAGSSLRATWSRAFRSPRIANKGREALYAIIIYGGLVIALFAVKIVHALHMVNAMPPLAQ